MNRAVAPLAAPIAVRRLPTATLAAPRYGLGPGVAAAFGAAYVVRASLAAYVGSEWTTSFIAQTSVVALAAACAYVLAGGVERINWLGAAVILAGAASLWNCETVSFALFRWLGWTLMVITVGPVNNSPVARAFRRSTAATVTAAMLAATLASAAWWAGGLPNLGRGDFTGVMWHSMTLGPLAALAGLAALARAASGAAPGWYAVFATAGAVATLAASRSALAAMAVGVAVVVALKFKRRPIIATLALATTVAAAVAPQTSVDVLSHVLPANLTSGLARKNWDHTRQAHWQARWDEFWHSPITGVGFASGWEGTAGYNDETGAIETGSSYLSILSMSGGVGAAAFASLVLSLAVGAWRAWPRFSPRERLEAGSLAGFWAVHLGAEGYVYAVGSLMGMTFWLWLGRLGDQVDVARGERR